MIEQVKVAVKTDDGGVVVMSIVTNDGANIRVEPTTEYINEQITKSSAHDWGGKPISWRRIDDAELPDRHFRGAWEDNGRLGINMARAREIHLNDIRRARDLRLAELDTTYMRADERGDLGEKQQIARRKQALRDLPITFDLTVAKTPEELKALWPEELA